MESLYHFTLKIGFNIMKSLYQRFLDEREEIMKHKWIESEKRGYNIGFEWALIDWVKNHRKSWLNDYQN